MAVATSSLPLTVIFKKDRGLLLATTWPPNIEEADIKTKYRFMYAISVQIKMLEQNIYLDWVAINEHHVLTSACGCILPAGEREQIPQLKTCAGYLMDLVGVGQLPSPAPVMYMGLDSITCYYTRQQIPMDNVFVSPNAQH